MKRRTFLATLPAATLLAAPRPGDPVFPYGAVYFRKSNPPPEDWAKDHQTAARLGINNFRHWFLWSAVEVAPGKFDWADYDRMFVLAAENGIKVTVAEMITAAPEWMFDDYRHARYLASDDTVTHSQISGSSATGGFPGLCLDNEDVKARAGLFLTALVNRYKDHPAMWAWDLWNEHAWPGGAPPKMLCYCEATQQKFRTWLQAKYGTLEKLGQAWYRHSYASWEHVHPPRNLGGYPESLDWLDFRVDNQFRLHQWRVDLVRKLDQRNKVTAHGIASTLEGLPGAANNEWRSAAQVDVWGLTWVASRKGSELWKQFHALDLTRAGARGKPFWHAEAQAGPLWMQPQVIGRPREDGRITEEKDVRLWNLISMAGGATGILYPRWRPLLDGPLFGAFGPMAMDGSVTPRAEMAGQLARWANQQPDLWRSRPVRGDVGIVFVPEAEVFNFVQQQGSTKHYAESARGAYQAFFDANIQADFVHVDDVKDYPLVYLPYPIHLQSATAQKLAAYVKAGGILVSEALPGYFGEHGKVGTKQPNFGLDAVFGATESYVEFTPDLLEKLTFQVNGQTLGGRYFMQQFALAGGKQVGQYADGTIAAVEHKFGQGKSLLLGSFPGGSYFLHHAPSTRSFFASLLPWAGRKPRLTCSDPGLQARRHTGDGGRSLWVVNPTRSPRTVTITLDTAVSRTQELWQKGSPAVKINGNKLELTVQDRNAAVLRLEA
ncbi:MAG: beta-galactosidase [Acidobacteria bacterium]|nr:beta-galactosidase [Acidobacteriota bacterium]